VGALICKPYGSGENESGCGWWTADHVMRARVAAHLAMLAWIGGEPMLAAA
jgi:hypothetical protein